MDLIGLLRVMQSGVNPHKAGRIVGCNIVYVIFLIIFNSIINQSKKNDNQSGIEPKTKKTITKRLCLNILMNKQTVNKFVQIYTSLEHKNRNKTDNRMDTQISKIHFVYLKILIIFRCKIIKYSKY